MLSGKSNDPRKFSLKLESISEALKEKKKQIQKYLTPGSYDDALTVDAFNALSDRFVLSDFLTYGYADDEYDAIWLDDNPNGSNSILLGYQVSPLIMAGEKATTKLEKIIKQLPYGAVLTSIVHACDDIEGYLENWAMARCNAQEPIFDVITKRRAKYMLDWGVEKTKPMSRGVSYKPRAINYYFFVRVPADFKQYTQENVSGFLDRVDKVHNILTSQMDTGHMPVKRFSGTEMSIVIRRLTNLHLSMKDIIEEGINTNHVLSDQIIPSTTKEKIDKDGNICVEDLDTKEKRYLSVHTVSKFSSSKPHYLSEMQNCIGSILEPNDFIPGEFYAFTIIERQNAADRVKDLGKKLMVSEWHTGFKSGMLQNLFREHHSTKEKIYDYKDKVQDGAGAAKAITGVVISAKSLLDLENAKTAVEDSWASSGMTLNKEDSIAFPIWLASLPGRYTPDMDGVGTGLQRGITMTALNAATLLHVQGDWRGSHPVDGGMLLTTRRGVLSTFNLFKTFKANYNCLVAATSGAGKSFFMADWVSDFLARRGIVRIVDAGRSYYNLAEVVGGQNVVCEDCESQDTTSKEQLCFNIFSTLTSKSILNESLTMISRLVAQMCFPGGYATDSIKDEKPWEESIIGIMIEEIWDKKRHKMSILDIYEYCLSSESKDARIKDMVVYLDKWAKGRHSKWFVGEWNLKFANPMVVFELDELKKDQALQNVILNLILARVTDEMYYSFSEDKRKNNGIITPKAVIIDEAWDLLSKPNTSRFIEEAARRIRKYHGAIIIITQSFMDMKKNSASEAFIQNCNWIISLMQDIGTVKSAVESGLIDLKDYALDILGSLHKTDDYSELYIMNKSMKGEGVYRLVVDDASYWTYTTDGNEKGRLNKLVNEGKSVSEAINFLSQTKEK